MCVWILNCMSCLFVLDSNPLLVISLENIFSQSVGYLFILVDPVLMSFPNDHIHLLFAVNWEFQLLLVLVNSGY